MVRRVESELPQWQQYKQVPGNILNRGLKIYFIFTTVCVPVQYVHIKYILPRQIQATCTCTTSRKQGARVHMTYITRRYIHLILCVPVYK